MIDVITDNVWLQTMAEYKLASILDEGLLSNGMYAVTLARKEGKVVQKWSWRGSFLFTTDYPRHSKMIKLLQINNLCKSEAIRGEINILQIHLKLGQKKSARKN